MRFSGSLPIAAGLAVLATATGAHLGRSAIAEINPAHFSDPAPRFHADLVPQRQDWDRVQVAEYRAAAVAEGLGDGCIRCPDFPVEYMPEQHPVYATWDAEARATEEPVDYVIYEPEPERDPRMERVRAYSSYAIDQEEAEEQTRAAAEEAELAAAEAEDMEAEFYAGTR